MKGKKILSMLVVSALMLSALIVTNVVADRYVESGTDGAKWILSNDGTGSLARGLSCGEIITWYITDNSLNMSKSYKVRVWDGTQWINLITSGSRSTDSFGDLDISFRVPGWKELGQDPVGNWSVTLWENDLSSQVQGFNATIKITNHYYVRFKYNGDWIENLIYNSTYAEGNGFEIHVYNWTGTSLVQAEGDTDKYVFTAEILKADNTTFQDYGTISAGSTVNWKGIAIAVDYNDISEADREKTFWVEVIESNGESSKVPLPILLDVTQTSSLSDLTWGDSFTVSGKILDGNGLGERNYKVRVYYPVEGGYLYDETTTPATVTTGTFSLPFVTGSGKGFGAGEWYVGTYDTPGDRVDMGLVPPYINGFIPYYSFDVDTKTNARVTVENADDLTKGFSQSVNVSVRNESWMKYDEFENMIIHVTGIKGWDGTHAYDRTDIVPMATTKTKETDTKQYYEFDYNFNETGTGTILVSWPGNLTKMDNHGSYYGDRFGNHDTSLIANITGSTTFSVVSPGTMTVLVDNVPEKVEIKDTFGTGWVNKSAADNVWTNVSVFGNAEDTHKNASIKVTGCGLDFTIEEDDLTQDYLIDYGWSNSGTGAWYNISIIPKIAGTLTITVTNRTNTIVKDYAVTGLTGSVTTSIGDDLEIEVGSTEMISLSGVTEYAQATVTFYDEDWGSKTKLNYSEEAGDLSFTPDVDEIDHIGYIVVVAGIDVYDQFMYDIIEVVPIDDLTLNIIVPSEGNHTLTVGLEQDITVELLDSVGNPVTDDNPGIECKLTDEKHDEDDPLQEFSFTSVADGQWEATIIPWTMGQLMFNGFNASDGIKHIGTNTLEVDHATIEYSPDGTTAGIEKEDLTIGVTAYDANGNLLDVSTLYLWAEDTSGGLVFDDSVGLTDGVGEFDIDFVGDSKTHINATLQDAMPGQGNRTLGKFMIDFPVFDLDPDTIYLGQSNTIWITATDYEGNPIKGINLTFVSSIVGIVAAQPDPVQTDEDGFAQLSVSPLASGKLNVTIARDLEWINGQLNWSNAVVTDTYVTCTSIKTMSIAVSKSPIYQGETLTVTVTYGINPVEDASVTLGTETKKTGADGTVTFEVPDPGVDSAVYKIKAQKEGYLTVTEDITVIKTWEITISKPKTINSEASFTVTITARGQALAGAEVSKDGGTPVLSDGNGKVSFKAGTEGKTHTIKATFGNYKPGEITITVGPPESPGFELLTLIIAIGIALILLKRRRK
jgi:hypothetical protein